MPLPPPTARPGSTTYWPNTRPATIGVSSPAFYSDDCRLGKGLKNGEAIACLPYPTLFSALLYKIPNSSGTPRSSSTIPCRRWPLNLGHPGKEAPLKLTGLPLANPSTAAPPDGDGQFDPGITLSDRKTTGYPLITFEGFTGGRNITRYNPGLNLPPEHWPVAMGKGTAASSGRLRRARMCRGCRPPSPAAPPTWCIRRWCAAWCRRGAASLKNTPLLVRPGAGRFGALPGRKQEIKWTGNRMAW